MLGVMFGRLRTRRQFCWVAAACLATTAAILLTAGLSGATGDHPAAEIVLWTVITAAAEAVGLLLAYAAVKDRLAT
ncbi:hypothetical protein [Streptomyces bohaiensis]|uniref:Uncharacterized protein n=1 Tax=Streptomyces bohaiensis TaxID=1431344 RepID=A0ABX1C5T4_9ACTN|nr:hypothetical protein [Streptomyces bohaiensis]NJQ14556.1 hypothetical protein [Streptomyces bohaiensis]